MIHDTGLGRRLGTRGVAFSRGRGAGGVVAVLLHDGMECHSCRFNCLASRWIFVPMLPADGGSAVAKSGI